jgi:hypothetical protein
MSGKNQIEMNVAGVKFFMRLVEACAVMRDHITYMQATRDKTWADWEFAGDIDALLAEAGYKEEDDE